MIKEEIRKIHEDSKETYGAPKITNELRKNGFKVSLRTVGKYMREMGIKAITLNPGQRRRFQKISLRSLKIS